MRLRAACGCARVRGTNLTMSLLAQIQKDLVAAMKTRDELRLSVLRMVKTALKNKEVEKMRPLEPGEILQVLQNQVKQRRESVEQFERGGRADLVEKETKEIQILEGYLPAAPTEEELTAVIETAIAETGATRRGGQMGAVIKAAREKLAGKTIDGKLLSDRVRERLSQPFKSDQ